MASLSLGRFLPHLRGTAPDSIGPDLIAGLTVASLAVPQGMAYALVAGVPLQMGLYAAAIPALVAALFGSSRFLVTGPTNPTALLIGASIVGPAVAVGAGVPVVAVLGAGVLCGGMLIAFGVVGLGRASRFMSDSVVAGFAAGAGLLIALRQLPSVAGAVSAPASPGSSWIPSSLLALAEAWRALSLADPRALAFALAVPLLVLGLRRIDARLPAALIALALATAVCSALGWDDGPQALRLVGTIPAGWPALHLPLHGDPGALLAPALALAVLCTVQTVAAARTLEPLGRRRLDADRELVAQGVANVAAAFVGALPTSGSLTRSALGRASGARSRLAAATSGLSVAILVPLFLPVIEAVPLSALAGLVVLSGLDLVSPTGLRRAGSTRGDAMVLGVTLVATLWIDLVQAVYVGLFLSLGLLVRRSGRLQLVEIVRDGTDRFREIAIDERTGTTPAVLLHLEGDLNFAVAPELADGLAEIGARGPRVVVLRLKRARHLDATVLEALRHQFSALRANGSTVLLCGLTDEMATTLARTELGRELGDAGLLRAGIRLFEGFEHALDRTRALLGPASDDEIFRTLEEPAWTYQI